MSVTHPKPGAIAVVLRDGQVLLVRRRNPPDAGKWGFAGGHVEAGETALAAAARELAEETGVVAQPLRYLTNLDIIIRAPDGVLTHHFLLAVVLCRYLRGSVQAADDVSDARWFDLPDVAALDTSENVQAVIDLALAAAPA